MSAQRPRRTLRQSTKLIPTAVASTPSSNPYKRVSYSGKQVQQDTPTPTTSNKKAPAGSQSTPRKAGGSSGAKRGRKPTVVIRARPECFNNKPSKAGKYNDYHYGSDFEEDSDELEPQSEVEPSDEEPDDISDSSHEETLDVLNPEDIEDINSSLSNLPIWLNNEIQVEQLIIPQSSDDLILNDKNLIFPAVSIYEIIIKFYKSLRITPFRFEDFCACLSSTESSILLVEIHVQILKSILREDEAMNVTYGPLEYKDSIQSAFYFVDNITYVDGLITYFKTDKTLLKYIELIKNNNYPFCGMDIRVKILNVLLNIYLSTNAARETLMFDDIAHEDYCRICGRLGELICCETCTSVAHLGCINPPIIDPPDEWKCATCTKQVVPGLTDCLREEDKTSTRHEKLGYDRHGRSYWFLVRRIIVESVDGETSWYYSTHNQLSELLDSLSPTYESELIQNINFHKTEILSQMNITEKLTNQANTQHRKTYIDYENAQLAHLQTSRELINKQNELEKLKTQEEMLIKRQIEEAEKLKIEEEIKLKNELEKKRIREERLERRNKRKYGDEFDDNFEDMDFELSQNGPNRESISPDFKIEKIEGDGNKEILNENESEEDKNQKDDSITIDSTSTENTSTNNQNDDDLNIKDENEDLKPSTIDTNEKSIIKSSSKEIDDCNEITNEIQTKQQQIVDDNNIYENNIPTKSIERYVENLLKPTQIKLEKQIELLKEELMNNDEERMTRLKSIGLYKLGQENNYKNYINYFSTDSTALSKLQHNEERDKKRYMSHKFSLTQVSEFKWVGQYIAIQNIISTIKTNLITFENNIPLTLMHVNWSQLRKPWIMSVNNCRSINDFKYVTIMFRGCLRDCLFNHIWSDGIGHLKLIKTNPLERDEMKKTEKKYKKFKDDEDDRFKIVQPFVKYTIPCKHQLWKQKGEEYRLHGQFGWIWMRDTRGPKSTNYKFNLANGPYKYVIQVKSDNNKIKTMLIDPTVYNKLMAKRNLNLGNKSSEDIKPKIESSNDNMDTTNTNNTLKTENETTTLEAPPVPTKIENETTTLEAPPVPPKIENETTLESPPVPTKIEMNNDDSDDLNIINNILQNILNQLELGEIDCKPTIPIGSVPSIKQPQPPPPPPSSSSSSSLPHKKYNTELINVSLGIVSANRILYPKIAHRINILDDLLGHRLKLVQTEESQLINKYSTEYKFIQNLNNYKCYSYDCGKTCYSPLCQLTKIDRIDTSNKISLKKIKLETNNNNKKNIIYPLISRYVMNKKPNIFILQNKELMKLARTGGRYSIPNGFNTNNKTNMLWFYPCGRPCFYKVWEYNLLNCFNLSSIGMGIRILYSCIRWDDLQTKPPNSNDGKNQITTDMEIITSEILKHRVQGNFLNKIQYLRRKEIVPIDLPKTIREITPSRLGLRKRKRTELQDKTEPTVVEEWVNENQVEIWEIRYYGDKVDKSKIEMFKKVESPNTRIRSGIILKQPDKLDPSTLTPATHKTNNNNNNNNVNVNNNVEAIEPVQRIQHLSKRDNHVKINTVNKVQTPTASQQLQQQQAMNRVVEHQQKIVTVQDTNNIITKTQQQQPVVAGGGNVVTLHTLPTSLVGGRQQPIQRNVVTVQQQQQQNQQQVVTQSTNPQNIASVALQQMQEKQQQNKSPNKRFFVTKTKESSPKAIVNRKSQQQQQKTPLTSPQLQQMHIIQSQTSLPSTPEQQQEQQQQPPQHQQRLQIVRLGDGRLQLKGLLPGQHAYQTADGKIHVITSGAGVSNLSKIDQSSQQENNLQQNAIASLVSQQQSVSTTPPNTQQIVMTTPGNQQQQVVLTSTPENNQKVITSTITTPENNKPTPVIMATTPGNKPQIVVATPPGNKQQVVATPPGNKQVVATPPGSNKQQVVVATPPLNKQQVVIAATPGNKQQQIVLPTTPGNKQQIVMTSSPVNRQQIVMATNSINRQQVVMAASSPGNRPQFVMATTPGGTQQYVLTTTPGNKQQIVMATSALNKQHSIVTTSPVNAHTIATTPPQQQFLQQPLINISSPAMKTVISNSSIQSPQLQQSNTRTIGPNIIKGKQTPILISNRNQGNSNQSQFFLNQSPILIANQQQQQLQTNLIQNQTNKIIYNDGNKTYMINASGLNELQIKALANQFQQKRFVIKSNQEANPQAGQLFTGNVQQIVTSSPGNTQQIITNSSGQVLVVSPKGNSGQQSLGTSTGVISQQIQVSGPGLSSGQILSRPGMTGQQQIISNTVVAAAQQQQQQLVVPTSPNIIGKPSSVLTSPVQRFAQQQIVTSLSSIGQQPIVTSQPQIVQQIITTPPRTIVSSPTTRFGQQTTLLSPVRFGQQTLQSSVRFRQQQTPSSPVRFGQPTVSNPTRIVQPIITTTSTVGGRQIMSTPTTIGEQMAALSAARMSQQIRLTNPTIISQPMVHSSPTTTINNQLVPTSTTTIGQQHISTTPPTVKPTTLPISIVSPSKSKLHNKTIHIGNSSPPTTSSNSSIFTMTTKSSPIAVSPTRLTPVSPATHMSSSPVTSIPITPPTTITTVPSVVAMTPTQQHPILFTSSKPQVVAITSPNPTTTLMQKPSLIMTTPQMSPNPSTSTKLLYQGYTPTTNIMQQVSTTSMQQETISPIVISKQLNQSISPSSTVQHLNQQQQQQQQTVAIPQPIPSTSTINNQNSKITAQIFETPSGSKIVIQGSNKFSPEELLQIQTQLKKQLSIGSDKLKIPELPSPISSISSIDDSINLVIQNTKIKNSNKKNKIKNINNKDKLLNENTTTTTTTTTTSPPIGNSASLSPSLLLPLPSLLPLPPPLIQQQPIESNNNNNNNNNKSNKKLSKVHQRTKLLAILGKYKEILKKDIERKRDIMENEFKIAIQKEIVQEKIILQNTVIVQPSSSNSKGMKRKISHGGGGKPKKKKTKTEMDLTKKYCICCTPYDETKFYVGCEKCSNWFHGDCIGISQAMAKCLSDYICDLCQTKEKTYCLCKQPYDESQFYICCDKCQDWFHGRCIGVIQSESIKMDEYVCPNCDPYTELNSTNLKILNPDDFSLMHKLVKQMLLHKSAWAFIKPVDVKDAPNYYKIIKEPMGMDLQTVDLRVSEKVYTRLRDFIGDVTKIFDNCRYYNAENSEFYKLANNLEVFFKEKVILLRKKLI